MATTSKKKTKGRQKMPLQLIEKESNRLVTFSKRRDGLFKKASEICTLCGLQALIIVFSAAGKVYSFGQPSVEALVNRFLYRNRARPNRNAVPEGETLIRSNKRVSSLKDRLDLEKKRTKELLKARMSKNGEALKFLTPVEDLTLPEVKQMRGKLIGLKNIVEQYEQALLQAHAPSNQSLTPNPSALPLTSRNPEGQTQFYYPSNMSGGQTHNPNLNPTPTLLRTHTLPNFSDTSQMFMVTPPYMRGPNDNSPMMMIPTPMGAFNDPSMRSNLMNVGFNNPNMLQPFQGPSNPIQSHFNDQQIMPTNMENNHVTGAYPSFTNLLMSQGPSNPIQGWFDSHQTMPTNMASNPVPGAYPSFTNLLGGEGSSTTPNPPSNLQGGCGFGPVMN